MESNSSVETLDEVTRQIRVSIPADDMQREVQSELARVAKRAQIKGFRAGKAPIDLVKKMHGDSVQWDVAQRLISSKIETVLKENKIDIIGSPRVDSLTLEPGQDVQCTAKVSVFPTPTIQEYTNVAVNVERKEATDKEVEEVVGRVLDSKATSKPITTRTASKSGDLLRGQVTVTKEADPSGTPEPITFQLGKAILPKEVEDGLEGIAIGESREVVVDEDGKKTTYRFALEALEEKILPELTDEFVAAQPFGVATVEELRTKIRTDLQAEYKRECDAAAHTQIVDALVEKNQFQVPQELVDDEIRSMISRTGLANNLTIGGKEFDLTPFRDALNDSAVKRVRGAIIIDRVGEAEAIKASKEELEAAMQDVADRNSVTVEQVQKYLAQENRFVGFVMEVTRNKVLDFLLSKAKVTYTSGAAEPSEKPKKGTKKK